MAKVKETEIGFEAAMTELEKIVMQLESGDLPLERALELWEKGVALSQRCEAQLQEAERKVELLIKERGELKTVSFTPDINKVDTAEKKGEVKISNDDEVPF